MNMWLWDSISSFFICSGFIIALVLAGSLVRHKLAMKIMNPVWILTGLWAHFLALFAYFDFELKRDELGLGIKSDIPMHMSMSMDNMSMSMDEERPSWQMVALSTLHCGAGCTLADIIGEWFTFFVPIKIGGSMIAGSWILDFFLALVFGIFFQLAAIREMENISFGKALSRAFKADFFSLAAWQVGMYGWMAISYWVIFRDMDLEKSSWTFWFMMQIAMLCGFLCSYPMNALLIRFGIKKGM